VVSENDTSWLPPLVHLEDFGGNWERYVSKVYAYFYEDFVRSRPTFSGTPCRIDSRREKDGRESTFWHLISEGSTEPERRPDLRRCERIRWIRPMIEAASCNCVKWWKNHRKGQKRIVIAIEDFSYVVVLAERRNYVLLWTAYCVEHLRRRQQLEKEYEAWKTTGAA